MAHITNRISSELQDGYVQLRIVHYVDEGDIAFPIYIYAYISFSEVVWC